MDLGADASLKIPVPESHFYKTGYVWGGVDDRLTSSRDPLPRSKQLFPEADLNSRACWDKYSNSVPLGRRNLKSTAHGTLGVLEGLCASPHKPSRVSYGGMGKEERC